MLGQGGLFPALLGSWPSSTKIVDSLAPPFPPATYTLTGKVAPILSQMVPSNNSVFGTLTAGDQVPVCSQGLVVPDPSGDNSRTE